MNGKMGKNRTVLADPSPLCTNVFPSPPHFKCPERKDLFAIRGPRSRGEGINFSGRGPRVSAQASSHSRFVRTEDSLDFFSFAVPLGRLGFMEGIEIRLATADPRIELGSRKKSFGRRANHGLSDLNPVGTGEPGGWSAALFQFGSHFSKAGMSDKVGDKVGRGDAQPHNP